MSERGSNLSEGPFNKKLDEKGGSFGSIQFRSVEKRPVKLGRADDTCAKGEDP